MTLQERVLICYFSFYDKNPTLKQMSDDFQISRYRLSRILKKEEMILEEFEKIREFLAKKHGRIFSFLRD